MGPGSPSNAASELPGVTGSTKLRDPFKTRGPVAVFSLRSQVSGFRELKRTLFIFQCLNLCDRCVPYRADLNVSDKANITRCI